MVLKKIAARPNNHTYTRGIIMLKNITIITTGILLLISTAGYVVAGQGKGPGVSDRQQTSTQTRNQFQKQIQVDKNCDGPQIKTQKRRRTNYIK